MTQLFIPILSGRKGRGLKVKFKPEFELFLTAQPNLKP
jgi:hypothetical protein